MFSLSVVSRILCLDLPHLRQVRLIPNQHQCHVLLAMGAQFGQPPLNILKRLLLGDVIDEKRPRCPPIVGRGDSSVAVLPRRVPNLRLDHVTSLGCDCACCELHANGRARLKVELILGEACEQIGLSHA